MKNHITLVNLKEWQKKSNDERDKIEKKRMAAMNDQLERAKAARRGEVYKGPTINEVKGKKELEVITKMQVGVAAFFNKIKNESFPSGKSPDKAKRPFGETKPRESLKLSPNRHISVPSPLKLVRNKSPPD